MPLDTALATRLDADTATVADTGACGSYWAVAQTRPQAERWAQANLTRQGYPVFLPLVAVRKRDRVTRTMFHTIEEPLFRGYLFVRLGAHWSPVQSTEGVARLLMADGHPQPLRPGDLEAVQAACDARRNDVPATATWAPGAPCSLAGGPLSGADAVILSVRRNVARVALVVLGGLRKVTVPVEQLRARA